LPPEDLKACLQGVGRANLRRRRIPCHLTIDKVFGREFSLKRYNI